MSQRKKRITPCLCSPEEFISKLPLDMQIQLRGVQTPAQVERVGTTMFDKMVLNVLREKTVDLT